MNRKVMVGMLLLGALIIFALGTFYIEDWQFYLRKGYQLKAEFTRAHGLDAGDLVRLSGVVVGKVAEVSVDTDTATTHPVKAVLWIERDVVIRQDDTAEIRTASLFGGNFIAIVRGDSSAPALKNGQRIPKTKVGPGIPDIIDQSQTALVEIKDAFRKISGISTKIEQGEGTLGKLMTDETAYEDLKATLLEARQALANLKAVAKDAREGEGLLSRLLNDGQLAEDAQAALKDARTAMADLKEVSEDIKAGKGSVGKLLADEDAYEDLKALLAEGKDAFAELKEVGLLAREGEGVLARLLTDEKLAEDLGALVTNLKEVSEDMQKGTIGKLLASDEAYQRLMETLDELKESTTAIAEGRGTLGKLVQDDALYEKISLAIDELQKLVQTYREQSPLVSFAGSVFGAF